VDEEKGRMSKNNMIIQCWFRDPDTPHVLCSRPVVGVQGARGICKMHLDQARAEGRDPFSPVRKKEQYLSDHELTNLDRFARSFFPTVPVVPGEPCNWKRHCRGILKEVIGNLEGTLARGTDRNREIRFVHKFRKTIAAGTAKKVHKDETSKRLVVDSQYGESAVKKALAFWNDLGVVKRGLYLGQLGLVIAPHWSCCHEINGGKDCHFWVGTLKDLPEPLQNWSFHGRGCPCTQCVEVYRRKA
jgi:hypothetical protein